MPADADVLIKGVNIWYGAHQVLRDVSLTIPAHSVYAFIGPSGCGKTTLLRSLNRMNDFVPGFKLTGGVTIGGEDVYAGGKRWAEHLRRHVGMVFQQPNPLPMTIMQNMLLPVTERYHGNKEGFRQLAAEKLRAAALYDEIKDKLEKSAFALSGGQQQRLCIARALMLEPSVILFDEPCSALDPVSTYKIEELITELKATQTIIIVTHNMEQARRIADYTAFFYGGQVVEAGETEQLFSMPKTQLLERYVRGQF